MQNICTLDDWATGKSPEPNDLASWSNLVHLRSLQVENPHDDPVGLYFVAQWLHCSDKKLAPELFERTFSAYGVSTQIQLLNTLVSAEQIRPVDLVDNVIPHGHLHRHLIHRSDVWKDMSAVQLNDQTYSFFHQMVESEQDREVHPAWEAIARIVDPKERRQFFEKILSPKIRSAFGFLNDESSYFPVQTFHKMLERLNATWGIHPAQVLYFMLKKDPSAYRIFDEYQNFLEPYANDIRSLLQLDTTPQNIRLLEKLPASTRECTLDTVMMFALMGDPDNLFWDHNKPLTMEQDPLAAIGLSTALSDDFSLS